jgi:GNAT superfamily N-acetyltransferase
MGAAVLTDAPLCQPLLPGASDPWTAAANDVVEISIHTGAADSTPTRRFHPTYTHQIFSHDETVSGYRGLSVDVSFNASTMEPHAQVRWAERRPSQEGDHDAELIVSQLLQQQGIHAEESSSSFRDRLVAACAPAGECVHSYRRRGGKEEDEPEDEFEIYRATFEDERARKLYGRLTPLLLMLIDGANAVDDSDPKWVMYTCYRRDPQSRRLLFAGFATVYPFSVILPGKGLGERWRVSQIMVLPFLQGRGLGASLLNTVYREAARAGGEVHEVTIEDPAPAMQLCRLGTDARNAQAAGIMPGDTAGGHASSQQLVWTQMDAAVRRLRARLLIGPQVTMPSHTKTAARTRQPARTQVSSACAVSLSISHV